MRISSIVKRSLFYFWRTHLPVILGVATAGAILTGALLVGDSVRASLSELFLSRLGRTDQVITSNLMFREQLVDEISADSDFSNSFESICPMMVMEGFVTHENSGKRASSVAVYGIDRRFWEFHGIDYNELELDRREVFLSRALAAELDSTKADSILLRLQKPSDLPSSSLHGEKNELGRTIRLRARDWPGDTNEFSLFPSQDSVRALYVPLERLQNDLDQVNKINTILLAENQSLQGSGSNPVDLLWSNYETDDLGLRIRWLELSGSISVESDAVLISESIATAVEKSAATSGMETISVMTYLANSIYTENHEIPYSLVTAIDDSGLARITGLDPSVISEFPEPFIVLNRWAADNLGIVPGDQLTLDYYLWEDRGRLTTSSKDFDLAAVIPISGQAADPDLAPVFPGLTETEDLSRWDPPFPVDLDRIRQIDEEYWDQYRTTPKAFISLSTGQELWKNRYGESTSIRLLPGSETSADEAIKVFKNQLRLELDPIEEGFVILPVRNQGIIASKGATDFGEYFFYFSFFLVVSALLITGLFFKLGVEQRLKEIGILQAVGFSPSHIRKLFLSEGIVLSILGSILGLCGAVAYAGIIMYGLRTWWVDAVGTQLLELHVTPSAVAIGIFGSILVACLGIVWTLRGLRDFSSRKLLLGESMPDRNLAKKRKIAPFIGSSSAIFAAVLLLGSTMGWMSQVAGFFGAGTLLMVASFCWFWVRLTRKTRSLISGSGFAGIVRLGIRNASTRPGRSLLSVVLIAFAVFTIISVDAFRRNDQDQVLDPKSGNGGFPLLAESLVPLVWDPNSPEGMEELDLTDSGLDPVDILNFRVRPGDDASCLNLYRPQNPRILSPIPDFVDSNRFVFGSSLAETIEESENPWLLLKKHQDDGTVPVIGDANSMSYVLHLKLGEVFNLEIGGGKTIRLKLVATLSDSLFQSELLMSEGNFLRFFSDHQGFRFFLIDTEPEQSAKVADFLEDRLADFGFDVSRTTEKLAGFHRVENTYLSTFQTLGGLGLILGTFGLAAVLLRNVFERRHELALLRAVGYRSSHFLVMILAENALLIFWGLLTGVICALTAITPALLSHGGSLSVISTGSILLIVLASGLLSSLAAIMAVVRSPLLPALRHE